MIARLNVLLGLTYFLTVAPASSTLPGLPGSELTITCPPSAKITCGDPSDPGTLGEATATSSCPGSITITYADVPGTTGCPAERFEEFFNRVWTATDACGNTASCSQLVDVVKERWDLDIKPTSCPNPINIGSGGVVSIAILGTAARDVHAIDISSIQLWRIHCASGPGVPVDSRYEDVARPFGGQQPCGCSTDGPDGFVDLILRFDESALEAALGLAGEPCDSFVQLVLSADLTNTRCSIVGSDCVQVRCGTQGCTLGYWKNHADSWPPTGYAPANDFDTVFGVNAFTPDLTLMQALNLGGGGLRKLARQGTAALLSATHPGVDYPLSGPEVISMVHEAIVSGAYEPLATTLDDYNNLGCPLN